MNKRKVTKIIFTDDQGNQTDITNHPYWKRLGDKIVGK